MNNPQSKKTIQKLKLGKSTQEEIRKKQQRMTSVILEGLPPEEKEDFLEDRRKVSRELKLPSKIRAALWKDDLQRGWDLFRTDLKMTRSIRILEGWIEGLRIVVAVGLITHPETFLPQYKCAFSICGHRENYKLRTGLSVASRRLLPDNKHPYTFVIGLTSSGALSEAKTASLCSAHIRMDIAAGRIPIPRQLMKQISEKDDTDYSLRLECVDVVRVYHNVLSSQKKDKSKTTDPA